MYMFEINIIVQNNGDVHMTANGSPDCDLIWSHKSLHQPTQRY